ncbi:gliding motility-associated C-terminal domain-containing protein [Aestuariivivens sediminis]|uniref:HYR-like domain-containing protein n=1 Tax=Aestuariivivens sediminis TaxID=2913557 RepID=UPI001F596284|nr:gliding motility-associated C-terminal domain-containing protein [Aestuariivivens sediminis]
MNIKPTLLYLVMLFMANSMYSQTIACEDSSCTANDYTLDYFYLGDENGVAYGPGYCDLGVSLNTHIWTTFLTNSAADRYSLYIHFNVYINDVFVETVDTCHYEYESVPANVLTDLYSFNWGCGDDIVVKDFYMSWQPNGSKGCGCNGAKCYMEEEIDVRGPLIANFEFSENCSTPYTIDFNSTTKGGLPPYNYTYLWDFGDGTTSTLKNPTHTFASGGPYQITLSVYDTVDTVSYTYQIDTIESNIPPKLTAPDDLDLEGCGTLNIPILPFSSVEAVITEGSFNAYGGSLELTNNLISLFYLDTISSETCPLTITRTFTAIDDCNNSGTAIQIIIVNDTTFPMASSPEPITIQCIADLPEPNIDVIKDATDNCVNLTIDWLSDKSDNNTCPETITRTYSVSDGCGNSINVTQSIIIHDRIAPTATAPPEMGLECIELVPDPDPDIITDEADNCSIPVVAFVSETSNTQYCSEIITRTYSITDDCDNVTFLSHNITIIDTIAPELVSEAQDKTVLCDGNGNTTELNEWLVSHGGAYATDNCGNVTWSDDLSSLNDLCGATGSVSVIFTATDDCGNTTTTSATFTIEDTVLPTANDLSPVNVECYEDVPDPDISLISGTSDNCSAPTVSFISDVSDGQSCPETITRTYRVADDCNNSVDIVQIITINDTTPPTATNPASLYLNFSDTIPNQDINIVSDEADNCGAPTVSFVAESVDQDACTKIITRIYSVTDACENSINVTHDIIITDNTPPTAGQLNTMYLYDCNDNIPEPDTSLISNAIDNYSNPTVTFFSDVIIEPSCPKTILRTYRVTDDCGNFTNVEQVIIIDDNIPPTASNPEKITVLASSNSIPQPDILVVVDEADNCSIPTITYISESSNNDPCNEIITRIYRVTDQCGNYIDVYHEIEIIDDIPPSSTDPEDVVVSCINDIPPADANVISEITDNNGTPSAKFLSEITNTKNCNDVITRTYRITDACGNYVDVNHNIFIIDDITPIMDVNLQKEMTLNCEVEPEVPNVTFSDNCTNKVEVSFNEQHIPLDSDNYDLIRTWTAIDDCDNATVFSQTIHMKSYNETTIKAMNVCVSDSSFDLNDLVDSHDKGEWSGSDMSILNGTVFNPEFTAEGIYSYTYSVITNTCSQINQFEINLNDNCIVYSCVKSELDVNISKIITPNNDNHNETFTVAYRLNEKIDDLSTCNIAIHLQLFNRWGTKVFESNDYENNWTGDAPNGSVGDAEKLPTGTYYYIVDLKNSGLKPIQGYIYLGTK